MKEFFIKIIHFFMTKKMHKKRIHILCERDLQRLLAEERMKK